MEINVFQMKIQKHGGPFVGIKCYTLFI